jgi:hypothetical protein
MIAPEKLYKDGSPVCLMSDPIRQAHVTYTLGKLVFQTIKVMEPTAIIPSTDALGRRFLEDVYRYGGTDLDIDFLLDIGVMDSDDWEVWLEVCQQSSDDYFMSQSKGGDA